MNTFSDRLKHARRVRGYTQHQLSRVSGVSQSAIASYESGQRRFSRSAQQLAHALKIDPVWLDTGTGSMTPVVPQTTTTLREPSSDVASDIHPWPFSGMTAAEYHALSAEQQRLIDSVLRTMLREFQAASLPASPAPPAPRRGR
ncbi:helix-turn-helix domain-containing protein [Bordetella genomosp. 5]|uniref:helix-turn-helix domain-containing protein n=1 Tax=Bordetella genomosp. 5 TaxID=1395608 RepID=UPI000B9ED6D1|nr:helix-turn-helix transcriptional regulator [Bordetella genomosp. 5]